MVEVIGLMYGKDDEEDVVSDVYICEVVVECDI